MSNLPSTSSDGDITADHSEVIDGMHKLYQVLIHLDYVQNTDVQVPPHGLPKDPVAVAPLRSAGLDPKTIELIGRLPCFTNDIIDRQRNTPNARDGIAIAPFSSATSYLLGSGRHDEAREVGDGSNGEQEVLPKTAFKLATSSSPEGFNFAYDLNDKTIIKWLTNDWGRRQRVPVAEHFDEWLRNITCLDWLPWRDDSGREMECQKPFQGKELEVPNSELFEEIKSHVEQQKARGKGASNGADPIDDLSAEFEEIQKAAFNRYWAKYMIFQECGWSDNLDKELFRKEQYKWNAKAKQLDAAAAATSPDPQCLAQTRRDLREFYKTTAGKYAME